MNILDFIEQQYPIKDLIKDKLSDPYKRIAEMDSLPYDVIGPDDSGKVTKLVEVDEVTFIPVIDLISYTREEIMGMKDARLLEVWDAYMDEIDLEDVNIVDIMECVKQYRRSSQERANHVLSLQEGKKSWPT